MGIKIDLISLPKSKLTWILFGGSKLTSFVGVGIDLFFARGLEMA